MSDTMRLPVRSQVLPPMRASKWLTCAVLLDESEMESLLSDLGQLGQFWIVPLGGVIPIKSETISQDDFLRVYREYVQLLKQGLLPNEAQFRRYFTSAWTRSLEMLYALPLPGGTQELIKIEKPVIQLQHHTMDYSQVDNKFRSMVFGSETVYWGIQFSYPQLYQDRTLETYQVVESPEYPNTAFFKALQRWMRSRTIPTPFNVAGKRINSSMRLGKCCSWVNCHPQLRAKGLEVEIS